MIERVLAPDQLCFIAVRKGIQQRIRIWRKQPESPALRNIIPCHEASLAAISRMWTTPAQSRARLMPHGLHCQFSHVDVLYQRPQRMVAHSPPPRSHTVHALPLIQQNLPPSPPIVSTSLGPPTRSRAQNNLGPS